MNPNEQRVNELQAQIATAQAEIAFQFERQGYFCRDNTEESIKGSALVFNRTVGLRDTWAKIEAK